MLNLSHRPLFDLCGIHIAYFMWARRYVAKNCLRGELFDELVPVVLSDVKRLCLPDKFKLHIFRQVEPTGKHLLALLSLWNFAQPENSQQWLTGDILFECLILNADGLINQRKTAQKILRSRVFDNAFAFRLACINFLESEIFKLWICVKEHFLNRLILEVEQAKNFMRLKPSNNDVDSNEEHGFDMHEYAYECLEGVVCSCQSPSTSEREEVLFWICYCLSKENGISITAIPHFLGSDYDWYTFSLDFAAFSGNVACFEYFKNFCDSNIDYNCVNIIQKIFFSHRGGTLDHVCFDRQIPCFVFNYLLLNREERAELFQKSPNQMLFYFLQWPLSLTLLDELEKIWDLVKHCIQEEEPVFELFSKKILCLPETYNCFGFPTFETGIYSTEHLIEIWLALWHVSLRSSKSIFLNEYVFKNIRRRRQQHEFNAKFATSGLREKLLHLFLRNGEAILELYENQILKESLRNLVSKYMPEQYEDLDRKCISFLADKAMIAKTTEKRTKCIRDDGAYEKRCTGRIHNFFMNYLKEYSFSKYRN